VEDINGNIKTMLSNKYNQVWVDGSWLLTRSLWMATKDLKIEEFNPGDVVKLCLYTISKLSKDWGITNDKVITVWDKWSRNYNGYWRSWMIKDFVQYKGSRKFVTEETIEEMRNDPNITEEELNKAIRELATNKIKFKAKEIMMNEFPRIGIPSYFCEGAEFDDIVSIASFQLYQPGGKPNVIFTKDSDLQYSTCPNCIWACPPKSGETEPKIITYDEMYYQIPEPLRNAGLSLYNYNALMNAAGFMGHNDMGVAKKSHTDSVSALLKIMSGDYSDLENVDMFRAQLASYDLSQFPDIEKVKYDISNFDKIGHYGDLNDFHAFCTKNKVTQVSDKYYSAMMERFDQKLFTE